LILILVLIFLFFDFKNGLLLDECGLGKGFVTRVFSFSLVEINKSLDFRIVPLAHGVLYFRSDKYGAPYTAKFERFHEKYLRCKMIS